MTIYEKLTILGATDFTGNSDEYSKKAHFEAVNEVIKNLGKSKDGDKYKVAWGRTSLNSRELNYELDNIPECVPQLETALDAVDDKDVRFDKITVVTRRDIDDNLTFTQRNIETIEHQKQVMSELKSKFDMFKEQDLPEFNFYVNQDFETESKYEIYHSNKSYFEQLHTKEELENYYRGETEDCLENGSLGSAYKFFIEKNRFNDSDEINLDVEFMKTVVEDYGTDTGKILEAIKEIADVKGETPYFTAKLLQDTLNTDEYKKAFKLEQGKTKEQENTK